MLKKIQWEYNNKHLTWLQITKSSPEEIYIYIYIYIKYSVSKTEYCLLFNTVKLGLYIMCG